MLPRCHIIGAGRVGQTVGKILHETQSADIHSVMNRSLHSAEKAIHVIGTGQATDDVSTLTAADFILITANDDAIVSIIEQLQHSAAINSHTTLIHFSGIHSAAVLAQNKSNRLVSLHPMHSFADPITSANIFSGSYCTIEGNPEAIQATQTLFSACHLQWVNLSGDKKPLYHTAACMASNYLVTLADLTTNLLKQCNLSTEHAHALIMQLMQNTIANCQQSPNLPASLTGPIQRGDIATLKQHQQALDTLAPEVTQLYCQLAKHTLPLTNHSAAIQNQIRAVLSEDSV